MRVTRSRYELYVHLVWTTLGRQPVLDDSSFRRSIRVISNEFGELGCDVLAIGGIADHVHLLVKMPAIVSVSNLVKQVKGVSSRALNTSSSFSGLYKERFRWQHGFGAFSISRSHVPRVIDYVRNQPTRHANGKLIGDLE